ncbi:phosphoinositide 3-kinase adapter protein 1 isoform X1 [Poeciliopsis prolifica]|uniref:phosphoinositide 3-kinase adapter protein 1 isoform X1 n=1 Tax=Poeciliopsis prolifica TaxID=188132 RepID=UPI00241424B2|nr:phosphoinositide 3-kinase adapter protein 1 isoform X1 [Poeciliopsis prolifica]XP_054877690.1 phosphoinositide 3-kinase adapter protein 1 isoform X1 [Poeciliopsis prolifica]XP_054877692.1 phosphoinositide 3-kinase adapter protein 1 isoform X1 [Poeciliopsis prolifica]
MEGLPSITESAISEFSSAFELLILHTEEAQEWAAYLQQILKSSKHFRRASVLLYAVSSADQLHGYNFEDFHRCKCIVVLLTGFFLDVLYDPDLHGALQRLLYPPHRVVALLCGVTEADLNVEIFQDWPSWRKLYADDEPGVYVSTVLESIADSRRAEAEIQSKYPTGESLISAAPAASPPLSENPTVGDSEEAASEEQSQMFLKEEERANGEDSARERIGSSTHPTCLTVQPSRVQCGDQETIFIVFRSRVGFGSPVEVEFSPEGAASKRVQASVENEFTVSVAAPEMPAGVTSLTLHADGSRVDLSPVTFYTSLGEVSRYLKQATDPVNFICQAFNLTSNAIESVDTLLTDSLKSRMPPSGLQLFGVKQIEENNMSAYQRTEELPTLLHFAAKYGLKKLMSSLLRCPGAMQAYSVMNKHGDYPNTLAEKSGFQDLRRFMDEFVETADLLQSHLEDNLNLDDEAEIYEPMSNSTRDIMMKYSSCTEDIYESMLGLDPECAEDLYEVMTGVDENPEEAMLRKFFQAKPHATENQVSASPSQDESNDRNEHNDFDEIEEEEDPYNICPEDIYDTVDTNSTYNAGIQNRPPAPIPRPEAEPEPERPATYISRVFSESDMSKRNSVDSGCPAARPVSEAPSSTYDPYGGMKTLGQRQLICLQERVKVGEITVDEAVQEFKAWQFDHERRANSLRYQQDNLKKLRDSITRRHKEREKTGQEIDYEISAPLQRNLYWGSNVTLECGVYEPTPRMVAPPPPTAQPIKRGSWKTGSTSSTSSTESNRLSTHSNFSLSSGTEPDFEDAVETLPPPPPRPPRPSDPAPGIPPPRLPPRIPERAPETVHERYISCPTRALPQRPAPRQTQAAPPVPRRR